MPVVSCPKCESRYDPGMDEELKSLDLTKLSLKVVCPVCRQWLRLPENEAIEPPGLPPEALEEMVSQAKLIERGQGVARAPKERRLERDKEQKRDQRGARTRQGTR